MANKSIGFLEEHIEKLVLAVIGLASIAILFLRVFISPNYVEFDNQKFSPAEIDSHILSKLAEPLGANLTRPPRPAAVYDANSDEFMAKMASAIGDLDAGMYLPQPFAMTARLDGRKYDLPVIGELTDISAEHLRAVAYVPTETVEEDNTYDTVPNEPNDLDLVTVEARFDIAGLCDGFYECFAGPAVREDWRDPCMAKPVFAAVQLQRKELLDDGTWSDWQNVPRTRIDSRRQLFSVVERVEALPPGGVKVRMLRFDNIAVASDLLQPAAYKIASAEEDWLPPTLHRKYIKTLRDIELLEKHEARVEEQEKLEEERRQARSERSSRSSSSGSSLEGILAEAERSSDISESTDRRERSTRRRGEESAGARTRPTRDEVLAERKERSTAPRERPKTLSASDIYSEFESVRITQVGRGMGNQLLLWAHDDSLRPNASYIYRMRLGVFNPLAGSDCFNEPYKDLRDNVILWSEYSQESERVDIPGMLYFFPYRVSAKTVTVQVSKFALGYWYSADFAVKQGELIGKTAEPRPPKEEEQGVTIPATVNYATGAVLVDTVAVNDWLSGSSLKQRAYYDMLYSYDGTTIEHIPAERRYWPAELSAEYAEIKRLEKEPRKPLRAWSGSGSTIRSFERAPAGDEPSESDDNSLESLLKALNYGAR